MDLIYYQQLDLTELVEELYLNLEPTLETAQLLQDKALNHDLELKPDALAKIQILALASEGMASSLLSQLLAQLLSPDDIIRLDIWKLVNQHSELTEMISNFLHTNPIVKQIESKRSIDSLNPEYDAYAGTAVLIIESIKSTSNLPPLSGAWEIHPISNLMLQLPKFINKFRIFWQDHEWAKLFTYLYLTYSSEELKEVAYTLLSEYWLDSEVVKHTVELLRLNHSP